MDKKYIQLFKLIVQNITNLSEQVMDAHKEEKEEKNFQNAQIMRDDYLALYDKLNSEEELNKADLARVLVGAIITTNQLETRIKTEQQALEGYKTDVLPKLDRINNAESEEEALQLAKELFVITENS